LDWIHGGSALLGILSAAAWLKSSLVKVPVVFVSPGSFLVPSSSEPQAIDPTNAAVRQQSKWSAVGAVLAALSILLDKAPEILVYINP
jgi:hypothetical protein